MLLTVCVLSYQHPRTEGLPKPWFLERGQPQSRVRLLLLGLLGIFSLLAMKESLTRATIPIWILFILSRSISFPLLVLCGKHDHPFLLARTAERIITRVSIILIAKIIIFPPRSNLEWPMIFQASWTALSLAAILCLVRIIYISQSQSRLY